MKVIDMNTKRKPRKVPVRRTEQEQPMEQEQRAAGGKRRMVVGIIWGVALLMLAGILFYGLYQWKLEPGKRYDDYGVLTRTARLDAAETRYLQFGEKLLKYSRDGVSVLDGKGTIFWSAAYNMQNPTVAMAGDYVAVADVDGQQLYVYDADGTATEVEILSDILQISVSEQGEVAVLMQEDDRNLIQIIDPYSPGEKKKVEIGTYVEEDGHAMTLALSRDGARLVTSYFHMEGNQMVSKLTFYSFTGVGQGANADRIMGVYPYEGTLFAEITFLDNNTICAYGDDRICLFSMKQKPELLWEQELGEKMLWAADGEEYIALVTESEESGSHGTFQVYDRSGEEVVRQELGFACRGIGVRGEDFWVHSEQECLIMRPGGKIRFQEKLAENVQYIMAGEETDRYFLVTGQYIQGIKLKEKTEE